jgi:hypothetical protein
MELLNTMYQKDFHQQRGLATRYENQPRTSLVGIRRENERGEDQETAGART